MGVVVYHQLILCIVLLIIRLCILLLISTKIQCIHHLVLFALLSDELCVAGPDALTHLDGVFYGFIAVESCNASIIRGLSVHLGHHIGLYYCLTLVSSIFELEVKIVCHKFKYFVLVGLDWIYRNNCCIVSFRDWRH